PQPQSKMTLSRPDSAEGERAMSVASFVRHHPLRAYFAVAYGLSFVASAPAGRRRSTTFRPVGAWRHCDVSRHRDRSRSCRTRANGAHRRTNCSKPAIENRPTACSAPPVTRGAADSARNDPRGPDLARVRLADLHAGPLSTRLVFGLLAGFSEEFGWSGLPSRECGRASEDSGGRRGSEWDHAAAGGGCVLRRPFRLLLIPSFVAAEVGSALLLFLCGHPPTPPPAGGALGGCS